jgi:hypothetical protein
MGFLVIANLVLGGLGYLLKANAKRGDLRKFFDRDPE